MKRIDVIGLALYLVIIGSLSAAVVLQACYTCKRPDCSDLPMPPEPAFYETRADAGSNDARP